MAILTDGVEFVFAVSLVDWLGGWNLNDEAMGGRGSSKGFPVAPARDTDQFCMIGVDKRDN